MPWNFTTPEQAFCCLIPLSLTMSLLGHRAVKGSCHSIGNGNLNRGEDSWWKEEEGHGRPWIGVSFLVGAHLTVLRDYSYFGVGGRGVSPGHTWGLLWSRDSVQVPSIQRGPHLVHPAFLDPGFNFMMKRDHKFLASDPCISMWYPSLLRSWVSWITLGVLRGLVTSDDTWRGVTWYLELNPDSVHTKNAS